MIDFKGSWEDYLHLADFQASIKMAPFEALYGRKCRSPLCWDEVGVGRHLGPDVVVQAVDKLKPSKSTFVQHRIDQRAGQI